MRFLVEEIVPSGPVAEIRDESINGGRGKSVSISRGFTVP
jgi:hypothetical protein